MEIPQAPAPELSLEQKEKEQLPILFVYRDNDSFREEMPEIISNLQSWGRKVETQVFPQGTKEEEIKKWVESNSDNLSGKELATDYTVSGQMGYQLEKELREKGSKFADNLDSLFNEAARETVLGDDVINAQETLYKNRGKLSKDEEYEKEIYVAEKGIERIIKQYLEKGGSMPKKVYVFKKKICDHVPFQNMKRAEAEKAGSDDKLAEAYYQQSAELVKSWLVKGGIPEDIIHVEESMTREINLEVGAGIWFVIDRHNIKTTFDDDDKSYITYEDESIHTYKRHNSRAFLLPFSDFYRTAKEQGVVNADPQEFRKALSNTFKKIFIEQVKVK